MGFGPVWIAAGTAFIVLGLADVFLTVLHYENPGLFAVHAYRLIWEAARRVTAPLPARARARVLGMVAPMMVALNLFGWLGLQVLGFALIDFPAVQHHGFDVGATGHSFATALYFSSAALTSLSFNDVEPHTLAFHLVAAAETLIGLGILTLAISYILNLYRVLQDQGVQASRLFHHSGGSNDPRALLAPHFTGGQATDIGVLVRELHGNLVEDYEGIRRYPVVWYFHTRRPYRSLPYIFWFTGGVAAALRWGLPEGHPAAADPWLPGLVLGFEDVVEQVSQNFLPHGIPAATEPVPRAAFARAVAGEMVDDDLLARFLAAEHAMCTLAAVNPEPDLEARYRRYQGWTRFVGKGRTFVQAASRDLGMDIALLYDDPARRWF